MESAFAKETGNPFPGLRPFRADEAHLFFGRESQVDVMVDKLAKNRLLALVGTSGSGKSSLVNCGLRPALHRGLMAQAGIRWRVAQFRPGSNPLRSAARALAEDEVIGSKFDFDLASLRELIEASLRMSKLGLSEVYKRAQLEEGTNLLVVVDQFEELFRYRGIDSSGGAGFQLRNQEATAFVNLLLDAKTQVAFPIYVVLTMRSDFLGDCAEFGGLAEAVNEGQYLVPRLTRDERREAIAGPVGVGQGRISPVLLTRLVNDVGDNPDQLSILQHALNRTWARWQNEGHRQGEVDLPHYEAIGTMAHALDQHAEKAYGELRDSYQRKLCEKIFKALTDKGTDPRGIRRPTKFRTLCALAGAPAKEVAEVIEVFRKPSRSFLMPPRPEPFEPDTVVDISHESLMRVWDRLKSWTDEEVQSAQLYRRLLETANWHAAGKAGLWDDPDLQFAVDWQCKEQPTEQWTELYGGGFSQAMEFLEESRKQRDKELEEKESIRQRELEQARALAEERQQRIEQQAQAARRLRGWFGAVAGVAIMLSIAVGWAVHEKTLANRQADEATRQKRTAEHEKVIADSAETKAEIALEKAREAERQSDLADREMRLEALRVRDVSLDSMSDYADLTDSLTRDASPQEAAMWKGTKGQILVEIGNYEDAEKLLTEALTRVPDDVYVRTSRGYMFLLQKRPEEALKDFEFIRDHIDSRSALNLLNLTIAQAEVGNYPAARISLKKSIASVHAEDFEGGTEAVIPPDVVAATGRTTLKADKATFEAALYYMQANLEAYSGGKDTRAFEEALARADKNAEVLSPANRKDAYFVAMTWAWLHSNVRCPNGGARCKDYGALASEAALWERAGDGYKPWAACYYQRFQDQHVKADSGQYDSLAKLVEQKKKQLGVAPSSYCFRAPDRDSLTLETEARENLARKRYQEANVLLDQALNKAAEPDKMRLLLWKAQALYLTGTAAKDKGRQEEARAAFTDLKRHCGQILRRNPREAKAYYYRAIAQDWLDNSSGASREKILTDVKRSLTLNPADVNSLRLVDDLAPDEQPGQDIAYLEMYRPLLVRYYEMSPYTSRAFLHQAKLAREDKQYDKALSFIQTAIDMEPDNLSFYKVRKEIEVALGLPEEQVREDLLFGYVEALAVVKRRGAANDSKRLAEIRDKIRTEVADKSTEPAAPGGTQR